MDIKGKIDDCYQRIQNLDIKPTLANMERLLQTLYDLREVYQALEKQEAERGDPDGRGTADFS